MRSADPFEFLDRHRDTIFRVLGILAALLVVFLLIRFWAMRQGGWGAATARVRRELAVTAHAFAAPVRAWSRHRRSYRVLVRGLRAPVTWRDAERALAAAGEAAAPGGGRPYAVLVEAETVTVLLAGRGLVPTPGGIWWQDPDDSPEHWTAERHHLPPVVPVPDQTLPVLVAIGETGGACAFLDIASGPAVLTAEGDRRAALALHQAVAAQVDARLPDGMVVVAEGVHRSFPGEPVRAAYRATRDLPHRLGVAPVLVTAELPDPLPPELTAPPGESAAPRILLRGAGRGHRRTLLTDRQGRVRVTGTPLLVACNALSRAIARVLPHLPPVLPPAPPGGDAVRAERTFAEVDEEETSAATVTAVTATVTADADAWDGGVRTADAPLPPVGELDDDRADEAADDAAAAVTADTAAARGEDAPAPGPAAPARSLRP
ncbi:hypothetical protein [Streptomyces sp. NPDC049879]|uniref:hypothetical protein n=1 Tax=Streptomyces sp. NPDC049879 TaxID=3365598 RepID=UPI003790A11B